MIASHSNSSAQANTLHATVLVICQYCILAPLLHEWFEDHFYASKTLLHVSKLIHPMLLNGNEMTCN